MIIAKEHFIPGVTSSFPEGYINVAATCLSTSSLGPGLRSVVWVQGCPFHCQGCVAPDWIPFKPATYFHPQELANHLLSHPEITGITLSGGEPTAQANGLANMLECAKTQRDLDVIVYSGYPYEDLLNRKEKDGIRRLLSMCDVLIDGPYIHAKNDNRGLRGSNNQRILHLTDRLRSFDFENRTRSTELLIENGHVLAVGVPNVGLLQSLDLILQSPIQRS